MKCKDLKKSINSIVLPEASREKIIQRLEQAAPEEARKAVAGEYVFDVEQAKPPFLHYAVTAVSACAVLAVAVGGAYFFSRGASLPSTDIAVQTAPADENSAITPAELDSLLSGYNREHGTQLRFPTDDECGQAGTTLSACFDFLGGFPDRGAFLRYVDILSEKGERVISNFHRVCLYGNSSDDTEITGYHYYFYNASGQTYGSAGIDGLRYEDTPDLITVTTNEGRTGYITKKDFWGEEPSSPEEAVRIMEEREKAIENGTYTPVVVKAYDTDGKTVVGTFKIG